MLTENEARDLLVRAANTIDVDPAAPVEEPGGRRTWPMLAAAAAVIGLVSTAALLGPRLGEQATPDPGVDGPGGHAPGAGTLDDDQIPSVFGYDTESAMGLLEAAGLNVIVRPQSGCDDIGRALRTEPATGVRFWPGDTVTLVAGAAPPNARCAQTPRTEAWEFVDFANGRGPAPAFADTVTLYVDGKLTATLTAEQAADPDSWGDPSAVTEIRRESTEVDKVIVTAAKQDPPVSVGTVYVTPHLDATYCGSKISSCSVLAPAAYADRQSLSFVIDINSDGQFHQPLNVALYTTDGAIDTVVTSTEKPLTTSPEVVVPDVVGMRPEEASSVLEAAGFAAKVVQMADPSTCQGQPVVMAQQPVAGDTAPAGRRVTVAVGLKACDDGGNAP